MNCDRLELLLQPYLDSELDTAQSLEVIEHLHGCPECDRLRARFEETRRAVARSGLRRPPSAALRERIEAALREEVRPATTSDWQRSWLAPVLAAAALLVAATLGALYNAQPAAFSNDALAREVTAAHIRSLLAAHLVDVASSDRHTVKPWFTGKLDFAAPVVDLSDRGFELAGGRLDFLDERPVAAFVYRRRKHIINLFVHPVDRSGASPVVEVAHRGYTLFNWTGAGHDCWAISDLNAEELHTFVALFRERTEQ